MKKTIVALCLLLGCTTASDARLGTRQLLAHLGIEADHIVCVGAWDDPTHNASTCTIKTTAGEVLVSHCVFNGCQSGCTMVRPGAGQ